MRPESPSVPGEGRARTGLAMVVLVALVAGCRSTPELKSPVEIPARFSVEGHAPRADRWWEDLDDPALTALVEEALEESPDLRTVWDRLAQARAVARREGAALGPTLEIEGGVQAIWSQQQRRTPGVPFTEGGTQRDEQYRFGAAFAWEIDLFGRIAAARTAARYDVEATAAELHAAAIALSGQVAEQWYRVVEQERQLSLLADQIVTNEEVLRLVTVRFRSGQAGAADVLRQRQLVERRRGEHELVQAQAQVARHALAVLVGRAPPGSELPVSETLPRPGELPEAGLPAELLERRPDVRRAYLAVLAADRRVWSAQADRLPRLSLTASPSFNAESLTALIDNWVAVMAANLVAPLLDSGRRRAEVERTRAVVSERIHAYGQTVLTSLREVEDALVQERQQRQWITSLERQLELARQTLARLRDRYVKGGADYLDVLDALSSQQELERSLVTAQRDLLGFRIALHRALAGGFSLEEPSLASLDDPSAGSRRVEPSESIEPPETVDRELVRSSDWPGGMHP